MEATDLSDQAVEATYARMRPDQRTAIANEFLRVLRLTGDQGAEQFAQKTPELTFEDSQKTMPQNDRVSVPVMRSVEDVVSLHRYMREKHPDLLAQVIEHPVTLAAMSAPGAPEADVSADDAGLPPVH